MNRWTADGGTAGSACSEDEFALAVLRGSLDRATAPLRPFDPCIALGSYAVVGAAVAVFAFALAVAELAERGAASENPSAVTGSCAPESELVGWKTTLNLGSAIAGAGLPADPAEAMPAFPAAAMRADSSPRISSTVPSASATERYDSDGVCESAAMGCGRLPCCTFPSASSRGIHATFWAADEPLTSTPFVSCREGLRPVRRSQILKMGNRELSSSPRDTTRPLASHDRCVTLPATPAEEKASHDVSS